MGHFREYYDRIIKLQENEWNFSASHLIRSFFAKRQILTKQGETENNFSFIKMGVIRIYIPDD